jgi:hypothetical protein
MGHGIGRNAYSKAAAAALLWAAMAASLFFYIAFKQYEPIGFALEVGVKRVLL